MPRLKLHVGQREKAWHIHPYPCIGLFRFLDLSLSLNPAYPSILEHLKAAPTIISTTTNPSPLLLDLGCCFGQDLRTLLRDGAPAHTLLGVELRPAFVRLGYDLFQDADGALADRIIVGDVLSSSDQDTTILPTSSVVGARTQPPSLAALHGTLSVVHAASFLHLWGWVGQVDVACRIARLLRPEPGVRVVGRQVGSLRPGEKSHVSSGRVAGGAGEGDEGAGARMYKHDVATFRRLWEEVGSRVGGTWEVDAKLEARPSEMERLGKGGEEWHDEWTRRLVFCVKRVA